MSNDDKKKKVIDISEKFMKLDSESRSYIIGYLAAKSETQKKINTSSQKKQLADE